MTLTNDCSRCLQRHFPQSANNSVVQFIHQHFSRDRTEAGLQLRAHPCSLCSLPSPVSLNASPESPPPIHHFNESSSLRPCFYGTWWYSLRPKCVLSQVFIRSKHTNPFVFWPNPQNALGFEAANRCLSLSSIYRISAILFSHPENTEIHDIVYILFLNSACGGREKWERESWTTAVVFFCFEKFLFLSLVCPSITPLVHTAKRQEEWAININWAFNSIGEEAIGFL